MKILTTNEVRELLPDDFKRKFTLDPAGKHLTVGANMLHNDAEVRTSVLIKTLFEGKPIEASITVPLGLWNALPDYKEEKENEEKEKEAKKEEMKKEPRGVAVARCDCGWVHIVRRIASRSEVADKAPCPACHKEVKVEIDRDLHALSCLIMQLGDEVRKRTAIHARSHGLVLYAVSARRVVILKESTINTNRFPQLKTAVSYPEYMKVHGPCTMQEAATYLRTHTDPLPDYLAK
jgi:hypothetical protein